MWLLTHITAVSLTLIVSALAVITIVYAYRVATWDRRHPPVPQPCPCCTTSPAQSDDCNCPEDCGVTWCQAHDPGDDHCPWCDTHACIDRTLCNCTAACGSWLCEAPAVTVDAEIDQWLKEGKHRD